MTSPAQQWIAAHASPPGMIACGLRKPDGKFICHSVEDICPVSNMESVLRLFENLRASLPAGDMAPKWSTWSFTQGHIRFVIRPDGWVLGVVVRPDSDASSQLDQLSTEFFSVEFSG